MRKAAAEHFKSTNCVKSEEVKNELDWNNDEKEEEFKESFDSCNGDVNLDTFDIEFDIFY